MTQEQFTTELKYIRNVSPSTLELYRLSFNHFQGALDDKQPSSNASENYGTKES